MNLNVFIHKFSIENLYTLIKHNVLLIKDMDTLINVGCTGYLFYNYIVISFRCEHSTRVAQLVARLFGKPGITGSIPGHSTDL